VHVGISNGFVTAAAAVVDSAGNEKAPKSKKHYVSTMILVTKYEYQLQVISLHLVFGQTRKRRRHAAALRQCSSI